MSSRRYEFADGVIEKLDLQSGDALLVTFPKDDSKNQALMAHRLRQDILNRGIKVDVVVTTEENKFQVLTEERLAQWGYVKVGALDPVEACRRLVQRFNEVVRRDFTAQDALSKELATMHSSFGYRTLEVDADGRITRWKLDFVESV